MSNEIAYNSQAVIQYLSEQIASLTRDNAVLLSALQVEQQSHQQTKDAWAQAVLHSEDQAAYPEVE